MIMNRQGVDMQVLSPASSYFFYWMAPEETVEFARWLNDASAAAVNTSPEPFVALGSVPMQDSLKAAVEAERAVTTLELRGIEIASNVNGRYYDDPGFDPLWEAVQALDTLVFMHPNQIVGGGGQDEHLDRRKEEYLQRNRPQASRYRVLTMCEF